MQFFSPWLSITVSKTINIFEKHIKELYKKKTHVGYIFFEENSLLHFFMSQDYYILTESRLEFNIHITVNL